MDWTVAFLLYLFTRLDAIQTFFVGLAIVFTSIAFIYGFVISVERVFRLERIWIKSTPQMIRSEALRHMTDV